jgi:uncharacterized protein involved in response to NO
MINITDLAEEQKTPAILRLGFRPLFLSAAIFAALAIFAWVGIIQSSFSLNLFNGGLWWHSHEMLFGFASAVVVGFLLTAVQTWTGQKGVSGSTLFILWMSWLVPRILLVEQMGLPDAVITGFDLLFLPLAAIMLALPIWRVKQYRNMFFLPVLFLLTLANAGMHFMPAHLSVSVAAYSAVILITLVMLVMGGRVIPFFTANGTKTPKKDAILWLERASLGSAWLILPALLFQMHLKSDLQWLLGALFLFSGICNLWRFSRWNFIKTLSVPLLWSLQLAYLFIPVSFVLIGLELLINNMLPSALLHGLTAGAMGSMILAMMARVSLGHTGRQLHVGMAIKLSFVLVLLGGLVRLLGSVIAGEYYMTTVQVAGAFWVAGFGLFVAVYFPILTKPRADGRPG